MNSRGFGDGKTVTGVYAGFSPALKGNEEIEGKGFYPAGDPEACSAAAIAKRPRKQPWVAEVVDMAAEGRVAASAEVEKIDT